MLVQIQFKYIFSNSVTFILTVTEGYVQFNQFDSYRMSTL